MALELRDKFQKTLEIEVKVHARPVAVMSGVIHILLGDQDEAIDILTQLLKMPFGWECTNSLMLYKTYPHGEPLLHNPRFQALVK